MFNVLKNFFLSIGSVITGLVDFVIGFIGDIVYVVKLCASFVAKIPQLFSWLPAEVLAIVVLTFSVVVIYKIMGREG